MQITYTEREKIQHTSNAACQCEFSFSLSHENFYCDAAEKHTETDVIYDV